MNSTAVLPSYGYYGPGPTQGSQPRTSQPFANTGMAKRRRLDSGEDYGRPAWEQGGSQHLAPINAEVSEYGGSANGGGVETHNGGAAVLNETSEANVQWHAGSAGAAASSSYPDVSSYSQQPYFFQHTDPNTYNSPWPPAELAQSNSYSVASSTGAMPYFPPAQSTVDINQSSSNTAAPNAFEDYQQEVEQAPQVQQFSSLQTTNGHRRSEGRASQSATYFEDASMHLKIQSLPILDNLATQLIHTIAKASFPQIQEIIMGNDTENSQAYTTLKNLFDQTRKVYSRETPFIDALAIQMFQPSQQETIRKANIATFISSILGAHDVGFFHLNEFFMETFVPLGHRLLKWQGAIYLELKTQTYISALINSDGSPEAMLDELFPSDLDAQILTRHPDAPSLSPSEQDFIDRSRSRKSYLLAEDSADEALRELPKKYQWQDFVKEFASCISKNVDGIMNVPSKSQPSFGGTDRRATAALNDSTGRGSQQVAGLSGVQALSLASSLNERTGLDSQSGQRDAADGARKTTVAASTIRQPWTKPEEDALLSGLDQVNGPHWSQILALYGRGGSISEVLKDRNQVQLKDKARNLKLWYLKMGKDVPPALRGVTGELRKRGGARARAALGLMDDDEGDQGDAEGDMEGDEVDLNLGRNLSRGKGSSKKKTKKGS